MEKTFRETSDKKVKASFKMNNAFVYSLQYYSVLCLVQCKLAFNGQGVRWSRSNTFPITTPELLRMWEQLAPGCPVNEHRSCRLSVKDRAPLQTSRSGLPCTKYDLRLHTLRISVEDLGTNWLSSVFISKSYVHTYIH